MPAACNTDVARWLLTFCVTGADAEEDESSPMMRKGLLRPWPRKAAGMYERERSYWIRGQPSALPPPGWSVVRDVLHWVK